MVGFCFFLWNGFIQIIMIDIKALMTWGGGLVSCFFVVVLGFFSSDFRE